MTDPSRAPQHQWIQPAEGPAVSGEPAVTVAELVSSDSELTMTIPVVEGYRASDQPPSRVVAVAQSAAQFLTCPECGTKAMVTVSRRESGDFCRKCDYPLFWVPSRVELDRSDTSEASLRRLPGTVGRATVASLACPHCAEPNAVNAVTCIRCGRLMRVEVIPLPPPEPVYVAPEPLPEPEPEPRGLPWWAWALIFLGLTLVSTGVAIAILYAVD
ncbi:hypothetical protein SAMN05892883_0571 [Jatrophihabitans sp. GAS493]|uniref:hypothetical protein n=1 Tax=Jatrophihabitans sp. GAS493 TaxID=1907575 RepID=UPI000BB99DBC|nr:hypothetical protein [Jatrophihabitans sp. GAS493]SOD70953.1 hypothetical protein SAMN05892883_0571 [Jatrophihabitans sp. GAS493]